MTSDTPKPRAGEHTPESDEASDRCRECGLEFADLSVSRKLEVERDLLRERERELVEALTYCEISTRADGQWADCGVNSFLCAVLARAKP